MNREISYRGEFLHRANVPQTGLPGRAAINEAETGAVPPIVHESLSSSGQPLDAQTRAFMESRFGQDFSRVRVHADERASASAHAVRADAYTVGHDIAFGGGQYDPHSAEGRRLLAHELTHVAQQAEASAPAALRVGDADSPYEQHAHALGQQIDDHTSLPEQPNHLDTGMLQRQGRDEDSRAALEDERRRELARDRSRLGPGEPQFPPTTGSAGFQIDLDANFRPQAGRFILGGPPLPGIGNPNLGLGIDRRGRPDLLLGGSGHTLGLRDLPGMLQGLGGRNTPARPTLPFQFPQFGTPTPVLPPGTLPGISPRINAPLVPPLQTPPISSASFGTISAMSISGFAVSDSTIPASYEAELDHLASLLNLYREAEVHIAGHADTHGTEQYNEGLSHRRAEAVRDALIQRQVVNPERLHVEPHGERDPLYSPEASDEQRALNRRVEIWYVTGRTGGIGADMSLRRGSRP